MHRFLPLLHLAFTLTCAAAPRFQIAELGLPGSSTAAAINDAEDVLFRQSVAVRPELSLSVPGLFADGKSVLFGRALVSESSAEITGVIPTTRLNSRGQSAGEDDTGNAVRDRNGRLHRLTNPEGAALVDIIDLNDAGHVIGELKNESDDCFAVALWARRRATRIDFGERVKVIGIDNADRVLLQRLDSGKPIVWDARTGVVEIAWPDDRYQVLTADAISDEGVITGRARRGRRSFAYVLDHSGFRLIAPPTGGIKMEPKFVNDAGDVVGLTTFDTTSGYEIFFAPADATNSQTLETLIHGIGPWTDLDVVDMNDLGQVIGNGRVNGELRPFILNRVGQTMAPVPEPSMLVAFVVVLAASRWQREIKASAR